MWRCECCGRESRASREVCWNCGHQRTPSSEITSFLSIDASTPAWTASPQTEEAEERTTSEPALAATPPRRLRARAAFVVFFGYLGGQFLGAGVVGAVGGLVATWNGADLEDPAAMAELAQQVTAPAVFAGVVTGALAMLALSLALIRRELRERDETGAAWVAGSASHQGLALLIGLAVGLAALVIPAALFPPPDDIEMGPLAEMAATPGVTRIAWLVLALLLAPPAEELLFRGVLLGGCIRSFGRLWGGVVVSLLFVALHLAEAVHYWPALLGIGGMALITLWLRLRTRAVGPAIVAHFAYNGTISLALFVS